MPGFSDTYENLVLAHVFGGAALTQPTGWAVGASSTTPNDDGTNVTEPTDTAYARVTMAAADWTVTGSQVTNAVDITFPVASVDWPTIVSFQLYDNNGVLIAPDAAASPTATVLANQQLVIPAGQLTFTLD